MRRPWVETGSSRVRFRCYASGTRKICTHFVLIRVFHNAAYASTVERRRVPHALRAKSDKSSSSVREDYMNRRNRYRPRYRGIVAVAALLGFGAVMPVALAGPSEIRIPGERTFPESITAAADGTIYIGSMGEGGIFRAAPGSETAQPWVAPGTN